MRSVARFAEFLGTLVVVGAVAVACGGVKEGRINLVDEDGGSDGRGGSGADGGTGGGSKGGVAGQSPSGGDAGQGEAGEGPAPNLPAAPVVVSVSPDVGESEVAPNDSIELEFSEGLDPSTVTTKSVRVYDGETPVEGTVDCSGVTVTFTPARRLDLLGEYNVVVTTAVTDVDGTALEEDFTSSFTVRDGSWSEQLVVENATGILSTRLISPVIDADGNALIVWGQTKDTENFVSVFGRYYTPEEGFGEPFEIDEASVACDDISVGTNAAGEAVVSWTENQSGSDQVWVRRLSRGKLGEAVRVDTSAMVTQVTRTVSAVSADGTAHVFWSFNASGTKQNLLTSHAEAGQDWTTPDTIYNYAEALSEPAIAFDGDGNGFVFFAFDADGTAAPLPQVYARRYLTKSGQWGNGDVILGSDGADTYDAPSAAATADGSARVVFSVDKDVKAAAFTKAGGFGPAQTIDVLDVSPSSLPKISSNGRDFLAAWYQSASSTKNAYSSLSEGTGFAAPELRSNGDFQVSYYGNAVPGLDNQGNGFVLFEQVNAGSSVDIAFGRLVGIDKSWSDGALINTMADNYQDPRLAVASNGVAIAAWSLGIRLTATSIYVSTFE